MDVAHQQAAYDQGVMFRQGFGICRVLCIGMCIVFFVAAALNRQQGQGE